MSNHHKQLEPESFWTITREGLFTLVISNNAIYFPIPADVRDFIEKKFCDLTKKKSVVLKCECNGHQNENGEMQVVFTLKKNPDFRGM